MSTPPMPTSSASRAPSMRRWPPPTRIEGRMKAKSDTAFLGHPAGLGWLSGSEFWERFSYYGMTGLLVLYMTHQLLTPEHVANIWGFPLFERFIAALYGA